MKGKTKHTREAEDQSEGLCSSGGPQGAKPKRIALKGILQQGYLQQTYVFRHHPPSPDRNYVVLICTMHRNVACALYTMDLSKN